MALTGKNVFSPLYGEIEGNLSEALMDKTLYGDSAESDSEYFTMFDLARFAETNFLAHCCSYDHAIIMTEVPCTNLRKLKKCGHSFNFILRLTIKPQFLCSILKI